MEVKNTCIQELVKYKIKLIKITLILKHLEYGTRVPSTFSHHSTPKNHFTPSNLSINNRNLEFYLISSHHVLM